MSGQDAHRNPPLATAGVGELRAEALHAVVAGADGLHVDSLAGHGAKLALWIQLAGVELDAQLGR